MRYHLLTLQAISNKKREMYLIRGKNLHLYVYTHTNNYVCPILLQWVFTLNNKTHKYIGHLPMNPHFLPPQSFIYRAASIFALFIHLRKNLACSSPSSSPSAFPYYAAETAAKLLLLQRADETGKGFQAFKFLCKHILKQKTL